MESLQVSGWLERTPHGIILSCLVGLSIAQPFEWNSPSLVSLTVTPVKEVGNRLGSIVLSYVVCMYIYPIGLHRSTVSLQYMRVRVEGLIVMD